MKGLVFLATVANLLQSSHAAFCNAFSTGPVANGTFIRAANSTLVVPKAPHPQVGLLSLWTGMGASNGDLIQALTESYNGTADEGCGKLHGAWCSYASTLELKSDGSQLQVGSTEVVTQPGDHVTQSYVYNPKVKQYDQRVLVNGKVVSKLRSTHGMALGWGTAEECQPEQPCGIVPAHDWINTVLVFAVPDPDYDSTVGKSGATGHLVTSDGGKTWTASKIHVDECNFDFTPSK